jgi:hypothetical protein
MKAFLIMTVLTLAIAVIARAQAGINTDSLVKKDSITLKKDTIPVKQAKAVKAKPAYNPYQPYNPTGLTPASSKPGQSTATPDNPLGEILRGIIEDRNRRRKN